MPSKQALIDQLATEITVAKQFDALREGAHQLVVGSGSLDAKIMMIGEAPGKQEDLYGLPFVGASGKFLDFMLDMVHLSREDLYITNIVKYRPPNNRDPSMVEKTDFWPYLMHQINIIRPKLLVTLGRHSLGCFIPGARIGDVHGRVFEVKVSESLQCKMLALYHPAAALYDGRMREVLITDFKQITSVLS